MVWVDALIESAGTEMLAGPKSRARPEADRRSAGGDRQARQLLGRRDPNLSTSNEDSARLGFEAGESAFMTNYTFAYASASAEAPEIAKNMGAAPFPQVNSNPSKPPLGGFNLAVSSYSDHRELAFEAAACLAGEKAS